MLAGCSALLTRNLSASAAIGGLALAGCESSASTSSSLLLSRTAPSAFALSPASSLQVLISQRDFHSSSVSERQIHKKYLRGIPHPQPHNRAKIDEAIAATRAKKHFARDENVTFDELFLVCRDGIVHKGQTPSMPRIVPLLDKIENDSQFDRTIVLLKHLQRQLWDFPPSIANAFINAGLRIDQEDKVVKALHRSVLDRDRSDEEPFYRMFPQPLSYVRLIERFIAKGDPATAMRLFSIAASQFRDNPDNSSKWNQVYCLGMRLYMDKKRHDQAIKVHREARYLDLQELPQMLVMRLRIEAMAEEPRIEWMKHMRQRLTNIGRNSVTVTSLSWAEATALVAYADNNATGFASKVPKFFLPAVPRFLSSILDPERVRSLWPLTKGEEEDEATREEAEKERQTAKLTEKIKYLKKNPFFTHYSPELIKLITTRIPHDPSATKFYSPSYPRPERKALQVRKLEVSL